MLTKFLSFTLLGLVGTSSQLNWNGTNDNESNFRVAKLFELVVDGLMNSNSADGCTDSQLFRARLQIPIHKLVRLRAAC